jgi:hypothetical protein
LELASAIAARRPETEILILSDGQMQLPERLVISGRVRYVPIGTSADNQAIALLSLQHSVGGQSLSAFVKVSNYGNARAQRRLILEADGRPVSAHDLEIPAHEDRSIVEPDVPAETRILEARLEGSDALPIDDRAWAVHRVAQPAVVNLVTEGNLFLETALALLPDLEVVTIKPADLERGAYAAAREREGQELPALGEPRPPGQPSLTILDAYVPLTATLPSGNLLLIAPPRSTAYFSVTGKVEQPVPRSIDAADPLLTHVHLEDVGVLDAVRVPLPDWGRPVVAGDVPGESIPLLFAGKTDGRRVVVLAFDLHRSDLPLQVAFPLLLANLTSWLAPVAGQSTPAQFAPGAAVTLALPVDTEAVEVTYPGGLVTRLLPVQGRVVFADTIAPGVYTARWEASASAGGQHQIAFAVNAISARESNVAPVDALPLTSSEEPEQGEVERGVRREWWRALASGALALLLAEWLLYQRATVVRIVSVVRCWLRSLARGA